MPTSSAPDPNCPEDAATESTAAHMAAASPNEAEPALRASEAFSRALLESSPDCIKVLDLEGCLLRMNGPGLCLMEIDDFAPLVGQAWATLWPSDCNSLIQDALALARTGTPGRFQGFCPTTKGTPKWWDVIVAPVHDGQATPTCFIATSRDITEAKQAEAALRDSETRLNTILQNIPVSIYMLTPDQRYLYVNRHYEQLAQITNAEIQGKSIYDMFDPEVAAGLVANDQRALVARTAIEIEESAPYEGELRTYASVKMPLLDRNGEPYAILGMSTDITARKRAERNQQFLFDLDAQTRLLDDAQTILTVTAAQLGQYLCLAHCTFNEIDLDADQGVVLAHWQRTDELPRITGTHQLSTTFGPELTATLRRGDKVVVEHVLQDQRTAELANRHTAIGVQSLVSVPYQLKGTRLALLAVADDHPRTWCDDEVDLLETVIARIWPLILKAHAEAALRRQEELLRQITDNVPGLIAYIGADERYRFVNATFESWFQHPRQHFIGNTLRNLLGEEERTRFGRYRQQVLAGETVSYETDFTYPDGVTRTIWGRYQPDLAADGTVAGFYLFIMDISERKQAEERLRTSEVQLNAILYNIPASVYMLTTDHRYLLVNRLFEQENNITNAEIHGLSVYDRYPPEIAEVLAANEQALLATKAPVEIEESAWRDGETRFYSSIKAPLLDAAGEPYAIIGISTDITERKRAEAALRQSEARYRTLFEKMDEGFCVFELIFDEQDQPLDYRFLEVNPAFARFTGLEDAIGKTARELVPNLEAHWFAIYGNVALTGEPQRFVQGSAAMGRWFEVYAFRFGGAESRRVALLFADITARKQVEDQLRDQEELLRQIADNVPGLIGYMGIDERYQFVNAAFESWFQRPRDQIIGHTALELIGADEHARLISYRQQALTGELVRYETDFAYPDGVTRSVWGRYQPHLAADGTVLGFYIFVMDISERKQAEVALLESERRFRAFFELAAVGAVQVDFKTSRFATVNDKFCSLTGYTREELTQLSFQDLTHPADRARDAQMLAQREAGVGDEYRVEKRYLRKDGTVVWVDLAASVLRNRAGQAVYSIAVIVDITERKAAEQALQQFNEQLEQQVRERTAELTKRLQELDQFAYVASHDLRAPLRAIDHLAQWVSDDGAALLPAQSLGHLEKMRGRIMRMDTLLNDLLAYSRTDRYQYNLVQVDVAQLLDDIVRLVTPSEGFTVIISPALPLLVTCKVPLETVLRNLIHNAIKHHDRRDGQVQVRVQDLGDFYEFSVSDDGPGIPPEFHERIFQIFQTLKPRDQVEGSGMGLAIVKKAVEHYGGTVRVESDGGRGTTFSFTWPKELASV